MSYNIFLESFVFYLTDSLLYIGWAQRRSSTVVINASMEFL